MQLSPKEVNKAMAKYLDLDKRTMVKAGDFANSKVSKA